MHGGVYRQDFVAAALFPPVLGCSWLEILHPFWYWIHVIILHIILFLFLFLDPSKFLSLSYAVGSVNIVTDLYILILPMVPVSRMQLSRKKKIGVQCIFLAASLYVQHTPSIVPRKSNGIPAYRVNPGLALLVY